MHSAPEVNKHSRNRLAAGVDPAESLAILGVRIHRISVRDVLQRLDQMASSGRPHHVVTVNPEFLMIARRDAVFHRVLNQADLALPDGIGIVLAARWLGKPVRERVTGVDTVEHFSELAARRGYRIFLLGAAEGVADLAAAKLTAKYPGLQIAGTYSGSPDPAHDAELRSRIAAAKPHALFVAFGAPKQDLWISRNQPELGIPVAMGVGGTFDFIAGIASRAPRWIRTIGMEWCYRLIREPWRWRRMLALPRFALIVLCAPGSPDKR